MSAAQVDRAAVVEQLRQRAEICRREASEKVVGGETSYWDGKAQAYREAAQMVERMP